MTDNLYSFEKRIVEAEELDIEVHEINFSGTSKGLYIDNVIAIDKHLSMVEKNCILAEEIGHSIYNYGDITNQDLLDNRKQERLAMVCAYKKLVPIEKLVTAYKNGCRNQVEVAEFLDVTLQFLQEAIKYYSEKYGWFYCFDKYIIHFRGFDVYIENIQEADYEY